MSNVELKEITKTFPGVTALNEVSININDGEFFVLLGPTGAGKTTTLRVIAGLEKQDQGDLLFDGEVVNALSPADRDTAFVFQQYSLYPTMTVYENLAFPLRSPMRDLSKEDIDKKIGEAAEILHISQLLDRKTAHLSGGEMQRVSIGRAIVRDPRIYLMDEPLSNLDAKLREALRVELHHLQRTQNSTTLFVTHDQIEALTMADRIAVLNKGRIIQVGLPEDIYDRPATTFVAQLVGTPRINLFEAEKEDGTLRIKRSDLHIPTPQDCEMPGKVLLGIRPEDIDPTPDGQFEGEVALKEPLGVETIIHIKSREQTITSLISGTTDTKIGDNIRFNIIQERLHCFDPNGIRIQAF
jgi:multiple sugar transport system ATP-binding protein